MQSIKRSTKAFAIAIAFFVAVTMMPMISGNWDSAAATKTTTKTIRLNTKVTDALSSDNGQLYQFTADKKGSISVQFWHTLKGANQFTFTIYAVKPDGVSLTALHCADTISGNLTVNNDYMYTSSMSRIPAGKYCIKVSAPDSPDDFCEEPYSLRINHAPEGSSYETEENGTPKQADKISLNKQYTGNLSMWTGKVDQDCYRFSVKRSGYVYPKVTLTSENDFTRIDLNLYLQKSDGSVKRIKSDTLKLERDKSSWKDTNVLYATKTKVNKGTYYVKITDGTDASDYRFTLLSDTVLTQPSIKLTAGKKSIKIKWKKQKEATGYQIYRAAEKNGKYKKIKTIKDNDTVFYTNKSLKKGKKYYYKVRAYKKAEGKTIYGKFSKIKGKTTK